MGWQDMDSGSCFYQFNSMSCPGAISAALILRLVALVDFPSVSSRFLQRMSSSLVSSLMIVSDVAMLRIRSERRLCRGGRADMALPRFGRDPATRSRIINFLSTGWTFPRRESRLFRAGGIVAWRPAS